MLKREDKEKLQDLVDKGVLKKSHIYGIWRAENADEMVAAIKEFAGIDAVMQRAILAYLFEHVWDVQDDATLFNQNELKLFKAIVTSGGVITRERLLECFKTDYILKGAVNSLTDMKIIDTFVIGKNVVYLLNLEFYNEVRSHAA